MTDRNDVIDEQELRLRCYELAVQAAGMVPTELLPEAQRIYEFATGRKPAGTLVVNVVGTAGGSASSFGPVTARGGGAGGAIGTPGATVLPGTTDAGSGRLMSLEEIGERLRLPLTERAMGLLGFAPASTLRGVSGETRFYLRKDFPAVCDAVGEFAASARHQFELDGRLSREGGE